MSQLPWAYRDWSYEAAKEAAMSMSYADRLMKMASEADAKADEYNALNAASGLDREVIQAKVHFYRGQASGYRQSAYYLSIVEGTNAND